MTKRETILHETAKLFAEKGYALSLAEVGQRVNLQKQSLYNYFPSKDDLIQEMLIVYIGNYQRELMQTLNEHQLETIKEQLYKIVSFSIHYFEKDLNLKLRRWVMLLSDSPAMEVIMTLVDDHDEEFRSALSEIFKRGLKSGIIRYKDEQIAISSLFILMRGLIDGLNMRNRKMDQEKLIDTLFNEYWRSISG